MKKTAQIILGFALIIVIGWSIFWLLSVIVDKFKILDPKISVAILTAATTVMVATITVVLGKYYERKKDIEAHYRAKKTEIYDEFLSEFFKLFNSDEHSNNDDSSKLVTFLRDWQRKIILWGGQDVLIKYIEWMNHLKKGNPNVKTMFLMEEFFLEIRKDLGHRNNKLVKGTFINLIMQNPELFMAMAKENPNITLTELTEVEQTLQNLNL
jgi:hypothetical protein